MRYVNELTKLVSLYIVSLKGGRRVEVRRAGFRFLCFQNIRSQPRERVVGSHFNTVCIVSIRLSRIATAIASGGRALSVFLDILYPVPLRLGKVTI